MEWTTRTAACLVAMAIAGCSGRDRARDTGGAGMGGTETGATGDTAATPAQPDMSRDTTGMGGMGDTGAPAGAAGRDTAPGGNRMHPDSSGAGAGRAANERNQTESGVTDSSGQSTLGENAAKTRPDQGQPVTSKGDTINAGVDSTR